VMSLKYKDLKKECKNRKLKATGTTEQLRNRLMGKNEGMFVCLCFVITTQNSLTLSHFVLKY
jgi:hypothetical protein